MKKNLVLLWLLLLACSVPVQAQRTMENLGRGLVAVKSGSGVYLSWRLLGQEWYDVTYNVYRDGTKINSEPIETSNFQDPAGSTASTYAVAAVVCGVEQEPCAAVSVWSVQYKDVKMQPVMLNGVDVTAQYTLNDASAADLDGDGEYELIIKRQNNDFTKANTVYTLFQAYKLDGTLLWTLNVGPNMINANHVETDCMAYDFDVDGKAEVVIRLTDGSILPNGTVVGNASVNYRPTSYSDGNSVYQTQGDEWLYVLEGATGAVVDEVKFDADATNGNNLARRSAAFWWEGNSKAYGHRANKFHFGAPYLDGRRPSIYVGRGCYTNIHMATYDLVNKQLVLRWTYACDDNSSKFYGQGYHNFSVVDVDEDGRDEICHGNMVIDEYGKELSSTGLGHGDAQHYGDLDPYRKGIEGFRCLEDNPGAVFVDAATNEILFRWIRGNDNGRCLAGNFTDKFPGAELWTTDGKLWSATLSRAADETVDNKAPGVTMNYRIYWDGDVLDESFDYVDGYDTDGAIYKYGYDSPIFTTSGCATNNHTKGNPCLQADLFGDWREEMVLRTKDNKALRIYTTLIPTAHRNYTLMHDKQYRQAIYWQMTAYNQPPHVSYFLGNAEGITVPPPPVMNNGRTQVTAATGITAEHSGKHLLMTSADGGTVNVAEGALPYILTVNSLEKDWTLAGAPLAGAMRLIKQGQGALALSGDHTYTGATELWEGVTTVEGSLQSPVWMNRFAELNTSAIYNKGIEMEYGAILRVAGPDNRGSVTASSLNAKYGAVIEIDIYSDDITADKLSVGGTLVLADEAVFRFIPHNKSGEIFPAAGDYLIAETAELSANLDAIVVEGLEGVSYRLKAEGGKLYLEIVKMRDPQSVIWNGTADNSVWNLYDIENFLLDGAASPFVTFDDVVLDETAAGKNVTVDGLVVPATVTVRGAENYTIGGEGTIGMNASLIKEGSGVLTITNKNEYTGTTVIKGGTVNVTRLATAQSAGALGDLSTNPANFLVENGAVIATGTGEVFQESALTVGSGEGGVFDVDGTLHIKGLVAGGTLVKNGKGTLKLYAANTHKKTILNEGTLSVGAEPGDINGYFGDTLVLNAGTVQCIDNSYSYSNAHWNIVVPEGKSAAINLDGRCNYTGTLTGAGTLKLHVPYVRTYLRGNWSKFEGTIQATMSSDGDFVFDNTYGLPLATLDVAGGCVVRQNSGKEMRVAAVTGTGTLGGSGLWTVGSDGKDFDFKGALAAPLTKVGSNTMKMRGGFDNSVVIDVKEGALLVNTTSETLSCTGTGKLTIYEGATLTGKGYLANNYITINSGATVKPGYLNTGFFKMKATSGGTVFKLDEGAVLELLLKGNGELIALEDARNLQLKGTVRVMLKESYTPSLGDSFQLWTAYKFNELYTPTLELPELPEGLAWDTTELLTKTGTLRVIDATGIRLQRWDELVQATVFTTDGVQVATFEGAYNRMGEMLDATSLPAGIYIVKMQGANGSGVQKMMKR